MGFYFSMVGFYTANFESKIFFLAMIFCMYLPATLIWLLQGRFDAWFDATYTAQVTYVFRVVGRLVLLIFLTLYWAIGPQTPYFVLATGFGIGVCSHNFELFWPTDGVLGSVAHKIHSVRLFGRRHHSGCHCSSVCLLAHISPLEVSNDCADSANSLLHLH